MSLLYRHIELSHSGVISCVLVKDVKLNECVDDCSDTVLLKKVGFFPPENEAAVESLMSVVWWSRCCQNKISQQQYQNEIVAEPTFYRLHSLYPL